jgi:hypothetical protein
MAEIVPLCPMIAYEVAEIEIHGQAILTEKIEK